MTRAMWRRAVASLRPGTPTTLVDAAPAMTLREVLRRFAPRLRPLRGAMLVSLVLLAAAPAIEVVELLLFQRLVDDVLVPADLGPLPMLVALYIALNLGSAVVSGADDYLSTWISQRFLVGLRTDLFEHLLASPQHAHRRRRLGDMMSRLTSDTAAVESFMVGQLTEVVGALLRIGIFVTALFWLQWELALASMIVVPLLWWASTAFARFIRSVSREKRRRSGSMSAVSQERLEMAPLAQSYGREREAVDTFHRENVAVGAASLAASRVRAVFLPLVDLAELAGTLAVVALGTWALATDRLTLGGLLAFLALLAQCHRPVRDLADLIPSLYSATAGVERIVEVLDSPVPRDRPDARDLPPVSGRITVEDVWVRYPGASADALRGLDLEVAPGEVLAVVGPSGAGKTTLTRLLTRYVEPDRGRVLLDGHDLAGATAASVRAQVTVVLQETLLLDADVRENIAFARPDASPQEVEAAARAADAHTFVSALPEGYATRLGARGASLSGGQRQRLSMARALLRDTPVLVLDEPTAGLDPATAERVLGPLLAASRRRTVVLVTHDPVALAHADRVVHLDTGRSVDAPSLHAATTVPS